ncbi:MAG: MlaE family lipid ABC transporter permease subunit [Syntrophorhabdaceae bacterium]|nr:MlaE family lipid ABC transporter permease subunit [Syntrophorhabdaceae bacterium]
MPDTTQHRIETADDGVVTLSLSGRMDLERFGELTPLIGTIFDSYAPSRLNVDMAGIDYIDSSGALFIVKLEDEARARSVAFTLSGLSREKMGILSLIDREALVKPSLAPRERRLNLIEQLGNASIIAVKDMYDIVSFGGELIYEIGHSVTHLRKVRWGDVVTYMKKVGVDGLPIVGLISFLLGLIMAFMSSLQLKQFGANVYVASLVAVAMVRELGPIMTAIIVAGRSGSAFAAEIGTMRVNEEVDALATMGFSPMRFLSIPKVIASLVTVPVLTIFASIFAIMGGLIVGVVGLNLTIFTYIQQTMKAISIFDIVSGLVKSFVFAAAISAVGCQRGFKVRGGAEAVGNATTSAVVTSIFLIIVIDSTFAIILHYIHWA